MAATKLALRQATAIDYQQTALTVDVSMTSNNTYYSGPAITVGAGTWLINAHITFIRTVTTARIYRARVYDGSAAVASARGYIGSAANSGITLSMTVVVTPGGSTTYTLEGQTSQGISTDLIDADTGDGNNATIINAIRLA